MGRGAQGENSEAKVSRPLKEVTWGEVKEKTSKDAMWVVIDNEVYNITNWVKRHPGGERVLKHYAGQDATDASKAFHNDLGLVKKYMKPIHVGSVKESEQIKDEVENDFREVRETARKMGLFKPSAFFYVASLIHILVFYGASWLILYKYGTGWLPWLAALTCFVISQVQLGWSQHDYGHKSVFKTNSKTLDKMLHYFTAGFLKGMPPEWWNNMHRQHHAKPNVIDKDPDVRTEALFLLGDTLPVEWAKKQGDKMLVPYNLQNYYFFLLGPPLIIGFYWPAATVYYLLKKKSPLQTAVVVGYYLQTALLFGPLLGFWGFIKFSIIERLLESNWFSWVSTINHVPMGIEEETGEDWFRLQVGHTCNLSSDTFKDWFTGHLNYQIEHHLFPTMPRHNLPKVAPLVRSVCEKHGISYQVKTFTEGITDTVRSLKKSGELWSQTRSELLAQ
ncbi:fatty acid desaturase 2 [Aplysia californica]|uniref:Fatty acid desaturase 2 n=1 Tax=Aplysia californica TaxID=6500 RepID=A0ABM1A682_APLCA|nr:fatty acid desaturase 2 [Aplysia californica]